MKQKNQSLLSLHYFIFAVCTIFGCYEPIDGCLDPLSANFSLVADNDCDDCCTFPSVDIEFHPMWDTFDLNTTTFYTTVGGDSMRLTDVRFLISNAYLTGPSASLLSSQDSVVLDCGSPFTQYNTFQNVTFSTATAEILNVLLDQGYTQVHFDIGIPSCLATIDTSLLTSLSSNIELFDTELSTNSYQTQLFSFAWDNDSTSIQDIQLVNEEGFKSFVLEKEFNIERGENLKIDIDVDYSKWFESIEPEDAEETLKQKLIENSGGVFTLRD